MVVDQLAAAPGEDGWPIDQARPLLLAATGREPPEAAGHWLDVALEGTKSNRDGIGAVVKVVTKASTQYNHMTTSVGYASSSHGPVHFGLGAEDRAQQIEIRWPSGIVQTLRNVTGNRVLKVREASG